MNTSSGPDDFTVFQNEPLMRLLVRLKLTPVTLGIAFFLCISVTLSVLAPFLDPGSTSEKYLTYFENISWSISMLCIFPLVVGLTLRYYLELPRLFKDLSRELQATDERKNYNEFIAWLKKSFNTPLIPILGLTITLVLNWVYFEQILRSNGATSWMMNGDLLGGLFEAEGGFSPMGLFAAIVQVVLIYWVLNLMWRGFVLSWGLHRFFNVYGFNIEIDPLHPDKCCGLRRIGEVGMILNAVLFLIGTYLSLKVIDKRIIQELPLESDIGNPVFLGCYVILAPSLFFLPLSAAHRQMRVKKEEFLSKIRGSYKALIAQLSSSNNMELIQEIKELESLYNSLDKKIPVWPLNLKSLEAFFGTVIVPVVPVALPFIIAFIKRVIA